MLWCAVARRLAPCLIAAVATLGQPYGAIAQDFPVKPLRLIIPFGAGGVADTTSRLMAEKMGAKLGQPIAVENIASGGATVAIRTVKEVPADGHTMVMVTNSSTIAVNLLKTQTYDVVKDLAAVSLVGTFEFFFVTRAEAPYKTLQDVLAAAKAGPGKIKVVPNTSGSTQHLGTLVLHQATGLDFGVAPSANSNELMAAVLKAEADVGVDAYAVLRSNLAEGKMRAIASTGAKPSQVMPNVGTVAATLSRDFDVKGWNSIYVRTGTTPAIIDKLNEAVRAALEDADVRKRLLDVGISPEPTTPARMTALFSEEIARWGAVIEQNKIDKQ